MSQDTPPKWITKLLERFLDPYLFNGIYGDLLEDYHDNLQTGKRAQANRIFVLSAMGFIRYHSLLNFQGKNQNTTSMDIWINYFKSSIRNLTKNKRNTFISLLGLVVSFITAVAIFQYCYFESSYDTFHSQSKNLYRVSHIFTNSSNTSQHATTFFAAKDAMSNEIAEIEKATHIFNVTGIIKKDQEVYEEDNVIFTTPQFFEMFGFSLIQGNYQDLEDPDVIMLPQSIALKYFGDEDPLGKILEIQNMFGENWEMKVAGVFEDFPANSHLKTSIMLPMSRLIHTGEAGNIFGNAITFDQVKWRWLSFHTYMKLTEGADIDGVTESANKIVERNRAPVNAQLNQKHAIWLQPVNEIHTTTGIEMEPFPTIEKKVITLFLLIGIFILLIAWINYVNISTARAVTRGKEVGIRKVMGSYKSQLRMQFLLEPFILNVAALVLAITALVPLIPFLESITDVPFFTSVLDNHLLIGLVIGIVALGSVLSGAYPAFILSNYETIEVLKGKFGFSSKGVMLRRVLVVVQLIFSIFLVASLLVVQSQMQFMLDHELGVNIDRVILIDGPVNEVNNDNYEGKMETLKNELLAISGVQTVSTSSLVPGIENIWRGSTESRNGEEAGVFLHRGFIGYNYMDLYDIQLLAGRNFDRDFETDRTALIVNELTVKNLGFESPQAALDEEIHFTDGSFKIVGVVSNFYQRGVQFAFEPMTFQLDTANTGNYLSVKVATSELNHVAVSIEAAYKNIFPDSPYQSRYVDDIFQAQYTSEQRFRNLFTSFTLVALIIACLGLIGLSSHLMNQKLKEVSIRKVLGAANSQLFVILNKEYVLVGIVSFVLTVPLIMILMQQWLDNYQNRITVHLGFYLVPFFVVMGIILITTLGYTLKVIKTNPAVTLKEE
ncbi:ABC transporter permease [Fulvivirgaceae bacterium BMA10]|uniref:ABC transporter permease n=1 Tax=Splendidivirga corallicola TaxID=3051826 RepID=A0ABT8KQP8_9BACT|nr:ABC transporter permease [Fulvivirgaceae bacterium BMA10]